MRQILFFGSLIFLTGLSKSVGYAASHFSVIAPGRMKTCFREFHAENETLAVEFFINGTQTDLFLGQPPRPAYSSEGVGLWREGPPQISEISTILYDFSGKELDTSQKTDRGFLKTTLVEPQVLTICLLNFGNSTQVVEFAVSLNLLNGDDSRLASKEELSVYQTALSGIEEVGSALDSAAAVVRKLVNAQKAPAAALAPFATNAAAALLAMLAIAKVFTLFWLRNRLLRKKID